MPLHELVDLSLADKTMIDVLQKLKKKQLVQTVSQDGFVVIARWNVNIITLRRIIKDHITCSKR